MFFLPSFAEAAFGGVPFEDVSSRYRIRALVDADGEGRRADGVGERAGKRRSGTGARRSGDKPERRRGRLGKAGLAQEKKRPARLKRAAVQASCRGEIEPARIAADFEEYRRKGFEQRRLLGDPERVPEQAGAGEKEGFRADAETRVKAGKAGEARLAEDVRRADPEERSGCAFFQEEACQRQRETRHRSGVARFPAMDFDETGPGQAAAKRRVEGLCPGSQQGGAFRACDLTVAAQQDAADIVSPAGRRIQPLGESALDPRYFPAQGENGLPRHGAFNHGGILSWISVPVMFLWIPEAHWGVKRIPSRRRKNLFLPSMTPAPPNSLKNCLPFPKEGGAR
jgi:hypothetical protein